MSNGNYGILHNELELECTITRIQIKDYLFLNSGSLSIHLKVEAKVIEY